METKGQDLDLIKKLYVKLKAQEQKIAQLENHKEEPIAIVGMSFDLPGAKDEKALWDILSNGKDMVQDKPKDRWDVVPYYDSNKQVAGKSYSFHASYLEDVDKFDARFFGIAPVEVKQMDPQHRRLLELTWEALEHASIVPEEIRGSQTAFYASLSDSGFARTWALPDGSNMDAQYVTGNANNTATGRIAYLLDFHGPNMPIDTACSSSLVAIDLAVRSLREKSSNLALAGGINMILSPLGFIALSQTQALSPVGRCKTFDASADGYVRAEGAGLVVLKRLSDAQRDGDQIYAVIRATGVNQDGASNGLTAPNGRAQQKLLKETLERAGINPSDINYIEAHGTGTPLGDPIEMETIARVYGKDRSETNKLQVASLKTNFGHLEAASGVSSLIKTILSFKREQIPPHLHFSDPNPEIPWDKLQHVEVPKTLISWKSNQKPRIAAINAFGFSGTNAHLIVEEAPKSSATMEQDMRTQQLLLISSKSEAALQDYVHKYIDFIANTSFSVATIAAATQQYRTHFEHRLAVVGTDLEQWQSQLKLWLEKGQASGVYHTASNGFQEPIALLFTGQGSQYPGMGKELYEYEPVFREAMQTCDQLLQPYIGKSIIDIIYCTPDESFINQTQYAQPAIFAMEYSLAKLYQSWGITPQAMMGHSVGEYVAACLAGVFSLPDALKLIAHRGALMQQLPQNGSMYAVFAKEDQIKPLVSQKPDKLAIAAVNMPNQVVISGETESIDSLVATLKQQKIRTVKLTVSHAFHSPLMEPMLADFKKVLEEVTLHKPQLILISNLTGREADAAITTPEYWLNHIISPVRFADAIQCLYEKEYRSYIEVGPQPTLTAMTKAILKDHDVDLYASLSKDGDSQAAVYGLLAQLYVQGFEVHWQNFQNERKAAKVNLPTYPFQRKSYWPEIPDFHLKYSMGISKPSPKSKETMSTTTEAIAPTPQDLIPVITQLVQEITELESEEIDIQQNLFEMGLDSIMVMRMRQLIDSEFGVDIEVSRFYDEIDSIEKVVAHINANRPSTSTTPISRDVTVEMNGQSSTSNEHHDQQLLERVIAQQMEIMQQQLDMLKGQSNGHHNANGNAYLKYHKNGNGHANGTSSNGHDIKGNGSATRANDTFVPYKKVDTKPDQSLINYHLSELIKQYNQNTATSKAITQEYRTYLANNRNIAGFKPAWKEMTYQLIAARAAGSKVWDEANKEFLDFSMGFGVYLFGHNPDFIREAVSKTLDAGTPLGPMSSLAGKLAKGICEMTGVERVAFYNTGTEAIMVALRLARTATNRRKIVLFSGAYHGTYDGILAKTGMNSIKAEPLAPGISPSIVDDVLVLEYGDPAALEVIQEHAHELAAVLVEPVQSRKPDLQPKAFLKELRSITEQSGTALIFDEVITGFRVHSGGAQAWFGIQADIVTYGKIIGGGLPIGIVGGKAAFLNGVDGGMWRYGDDSHPSGNTTFVAGTFCHHPLAMSAALAVLDHLKANPNLQDDLNKCTADLCNTLNAWFEAEQMPVKMVHFGSLFRFVIKGNLELLFHHLIARGIYIWEGRNCFISSAHTKEDIEQLIKAVKERLIALRESGYIKVKTQPIQPIAPQPHHDTAPAQKSIWLARQLDPDTARFHLAESFLLKGTLNRNAFNEALDELIVQHEALRTGLIEVDGLPKQVVHEQVNFKTQYLDFSDREDVQKATQEYIDLEVTQAFNPAQPPLMRVVVIKVASDAWTFTLIVHHLICDGWSMEVMFEEILATYHQKITGEETIIKALPFQFKDFVAWQRNYIEGNGRLAHKYWAQQLEEAPKTILPLDFDISNKSNDKEAVEELILPQDTVSELRKIMGQQGSSLFMTLLSVFKVLLHQRTGQQDIVVGSPVAGRANHPELDRQVGLYLNMLVLRSQIQPNQEFTEYLKSVKSVVSDAYKYQDYPFDELVEELLPLRQTGQSPFFTIEFALENFQVRGEKKKKKMGGLEVSQWGEKASIDPRKFDLEMRFVEAPNRLQLKAVYDPGLYSAVSIRALLADFDLILKEIIETPQQVIKELVTKLQQQQSRRDETQSTERKTKNLKGLMSYKR